MTNLFEPPPAYLLPLSKGGDLVVDFVRVDANGDPIAYDGGTTVTLTIDTATPITGNATINAEHALIKIESTELDTVAGGVLWRCVATLPTEPATDIVIANGKTKRADK